ncbi:uncharacterized protein LOC144478913 [Augochlora pura]
MSGGSNHPEEMISEYRDHPSNSQTQKLQETQPDPESKIDRKSYASMATNNSFPKRDQAITIESIEGTPVKEYATAIGKIINPNAIRFISAISNNRICIYLDSKNTVTELINKQPRITINNTQVEIKPLITPSQRIILSNVSPTIPHEIIEKFFKQNNVRMTSKISFLRAGLQEPCYTHVLSFERQVYVNPEDTGKIPESFTVIHDKRQYGINATRDKLNCFRFNQEGHVAKVYPKNDESTTRSTDSQYSDTEDEHIETETITKDLSEGIPTQEPLLEPTELPQQITDTNTGNKRDLSTSTVSSVHIKNTNDFKIPTATQIPTKEKSKVKRKTIKNYSEKKIEDMLKPAKNIIHDPQENFPLNISQLYSFLGKAFGSTYPTKIALEYTQDIPALIAMLIRIYANLPKRSVKKKIYRVTKRLTNELPPEKKCKIKINL